MNILLAFKAEPDLSMLAEADWQAATRDAIGPDSALMRFAMGNDEQGAAELMLQARDKVPSLTLNAVTLGDERALPALRHLAALGFNQLTLVESQTDCRFNPASVARQLAEQARKTQAELVLVGTQSSEGQNGQTVWLLAEMLGWPCLSQVCGLIPERGGFLVQCENFTQRTQWRVEQPAVLIVQNRGQMALRVPGMRAKLAAAKAEITRDAGGAAEQPGVTCLALERKVHHRAGHIINELSSEAAARRLWEDFLAERTTS
ncbi:electron transfer flavoprotein subunit beta/FixA family protein [Enterobacter chengduensis]|uniref:electron transfer flavoprotein subunit beta/FixA family protein n=1 Tax=Enterobacter chengduensis TaxID=2494701 RepID=UPI0020032B56|nr:electron transfer flavoprotein subunit beta/FixA family protein [Enterobacter chengduensis]MCK7452357.1 electron transfer flavoprotein subunit beta/FixA family protein [Enterobacter chengduensis]